MELSIAQKNSVLSSVSTSLDLFRGANFEGNILRSLHEPFDAIFLDDGIMRDVISYITIRVIGIVNGHTKRTIFNQGFKNLKVRFILSNCKTDDLKELTLGEITIGLEDYEVTPGSGVDGHIFVTTALPTTVNFNPLGDWDGDYVIRAELIVDDYDSVLVSSVKKISVLNKNKCLHCDKMDCRHAEAVKQLIKINNMTETDKH